MNNGINSGYLKSIIAEKGFTAKKIATEIGVSPAAVYGWQSGDINPSESNLFQLADVVGLDEREFDRVLGVPETKVYFRKMGLDEAEESARARARELAETFFKIGDGSYTVQKRFSHIQSNDPQQIAIQIRDYLGVEDDEPVSLNDVLKELTKFKFNIFFLPLQKLHLSIPTSSKGRRREVAFSASSGDQFLIVGDTARTKDEILFDICHELAHLVLDHPEETTDEQETLCNQVAQELVFPRNFIFNRSDLFDVFKGTNFGVSLGASNTLSKDFDWSPAGICYALQSYGLIKKGSDQAKILHAIAKRTRQRRPQLDSLFFKNFTTEDYDSLVNFFDVEIFEYKDVYRPFIELKNAASSGNLSYRRLAEILSIDSGDADELVKSWEREQEAEDSQDGSNGERESTE